MLRDIILYSDHAMRLSTLGREIILLALLACGTPVLAASAADAAIANLFACDQVRASILAQTGIRERPDIDLLDRIRAHPECSFTTPEVFRAAFGDKPMPAPGPAHHRPWRRHSHDDD